MFLPFAAGARKCIGDVFATTSGIISLAMIMARWRLRRVAEPPPRAIPGTVLSPSHLHLTATPWTR